MPTPPNRFSTFVRLGFASRGLLYIMLGYLSFTAARHLQDGTAGIFTAVRDLPGGTLLLYLMVVGFTFYGLFRLASTVFDIEHYGSDRSGWLARIGHGASALGHFALAFTAYGLATYAPDDGDAARQAAAGLLEVTLGGTVLALLGVGFLLAGLQQAREGISKSFMASVSPGHPHTPATLGLPATSPARWCLPSSAGRWSMPGG